MKTINGYNVSIPMLKNCRVDYKSMSGHTWSVLIEYTTDKVLHIVGGVKELKDVWQDFKFMAVNELPIDNYPYIFIDIEKLEGVRYQH